jgi:hypothetical protein
LSIITTGRLGVAAARRTARRVATATCTPLGLRNSRDPAEGATPRARTILLDTHAVPIAACTDRAPPETAIVNDAIGWTKRANARRVQWRV